MADTPVPRKVAKRPSGNLLLQPMRCTKIVATLGPASWPNIRALITAGVNVFRINFSHAVYESTDEVIQNIREASAELGVPVAILGDLCGPKVRVGTFKDGNSIELTAGESVRVKGSETEEGEPGLIVTPILPVVRALDVGHRLLLDDGELHLTVTEVVDDTEVVCEVVVGGTLKQRKGINCPDVALDLSAVTDKDRADAEYILSKNEFDYIALSFVQRAQDVQDLIDFMDEIQGTDPVSVSSAGIPSVYRPKIIAKIEKPQALDNIGSILEVVDGIMVARGDLGIEYSLPKIPTAQKMLIQAANASGKPVITATQMLDSMIRNPIPTRAECTDVANAVLDGTDAVMLSGETAAGDYPIRAVEMMDEICRNAETLNDRIKREEIPFGTFGISHTATTAAGNVGAEAIVAITESGRLARRLSKARLTSPTFAYAHNVLVRNQLCLVWGVVARTLPAYPTTEETLCYVEDDLMGTGAFSGDSKIVYCAGTNHRVPAIENTVRVALLGRYKKSLSLRQAWKGAVDGALEAAHGSGGGGGSGAGSPGSSA